MNNSRKIIVFTLVVLFLALAALSQRDILTFVATGNIKAYLKPNWSYADSPDLVILSGTSLPSTGCLDTKSDVLIEVENNGIKYYIADGSFTLKREKFGFIESLINSIATFSCKGLR